MIMDEAPRQTNHSARRINTLAKAIGATRYLEIGVHHGRTFFAVDIAKKTAVDPRFRFEWQDKQNADTRFFAMTSDRWFINHGGGEMFDIIFLDGLHTFEQTFRDFCNSLMVSHEKTIWIIDDTVPSDVYSSWPNQREATSFRHSDFAVARGTWQGDVFKMVFAIHDFFPTLSYCTVATGGNPQTIVWRQPRTDFAPVFNNLETVSRQTYFDFKRQFDLMRSQPEGAALKAVLNGMASTRR